jgi:ribosomal protein L27
MGKDHTLFATAAGRVAYERRGRKSRPHVSVIASE